jgi:hypothetical protein
VVLGSPSKSDQPSSGATWGGAFNQRTDAGATTVEASPCNGVDADFFEGSGSARAGETKAGVGEERVGDADGLVTAAAKTDAAGVGPRVTCTACATDASGPLNASV